MSRGFGASTGWWGAQRGRSVGSPVAAVLAASLLTTSCTLANQLDVCTTAPAPVSVNQHVDGEQTLETPYSMAVMPTGEALVLFSSTVPTRAASDAVEVRAARLSSAGMTLDGCSTRYEREQTLFPVSLADEQVQISRAHQVLPAPTTRGIAFTGLALLTRELGTSPRVVMAVSILPQGCFDDWSSTEPFAVSVPRADGVPAPDISPHAVALPEEGATQPYAVFWVENTVSMRRAAMGRLIRVLGGFIQVVVTATAPTGEPIDLRLAGGPIILGLDAIATEPEEIMLIWAAQDLNSYSSILMQRFDRELRPLAPTVVLASDVPLDTSPAGARVLSAFDGKHVLVLWTQGESDGPPRLVAQSFLPNGRSAGPATVAGAAVPATDRLATVTALPGGGFVVSWRQQVSSSTTGGNEVSLRMVALDTFGRKAFNNVACREGDFQLASAGDGDIGQASAAVAPDGRVLVAYAGTGSGQGAQSQGDIALTSLSSTDLFPSGTLRPTTNEPGTLGPLPVSYGGDHISCQGMAGQAGRSCTCDNLCNDANAICRTEELTGRAGGTCYIECDPDVGDICPTGSTCAPHSTVTLGGVCEIGCAQDADCGTGRVCFVDGATCWIMCAEPADCRTGICDNYSGNCANVSSNPNGAGLLASCVEDVDCRSLHCAPEDDPLSPKRCQSYCRVDRPTCPEAGVCVGLSGSLGICLPPCVNGTCKVGLSCYTIPGYTTVPVCMS